MKRYQNDTQLAILWGMPAHPLGDALSSCDYPLVFQGMLAHILGDAREKC